MPLVQLPFDKLDFGEIIVLDKFYNAEIVIVDMSSHVQQVCFDFIFNLLFKRLSFIFKKYL